VRELMNSAWNDEKGGYRVAPGCIINVVLRRLGLEEMDRGGR
jgi:hypothetical protein